MYRTSGWRQGLYASALNTLDSLLDVFDLEVKVKQVGFEKGSLEYLVKEVQHKLSVLFSLIDRLPPVDWNNPLSSQEVEYRRRILNNKNPINPVHAIENVLLLTSKSLSEQDVEESISTMQLARSWIERTRWEVITQKFTILKKDGYGD